MSRRGAAARRRGASSLAGCVTVLGLLFLSSGCAEGRDEQGATSATVPSPRMTSGVASTQVPYVPSTDADAGGGKSEGDAGTGRVAGAPEDAPSSVLRSAALEAVALVPPDASLALTIGLPVVSGPVAWAADGDVSLRLLDGRGHEIASALGRPTRGEARWEAVWRDESGDDVYPRSGDTVWVDEPVELSSSPWELPPFDLAFDREQGGVRGRSAVEAEVTLVLPDGSRLDGSAGPEGAFAWEAGPEAGLVGGAPIRAAATDPEGRVLLHDRRVPYVRVSLHPGDVTGIARPLEPAALALYDADDALRGLGAVGADPTGRFTAWIRDEQGRRVRPRSGDRLVVEDPDGRREMRVPELRAEHDLGGDRIRGTARPGSEIAVTLWNPWRPGEVGNPTAPVGPDGAWTVGATVDVLPASHYYVTEQLADGDQAYYCYQVPLVALQPGTPRVRVEALWEVSATLALERVGAVIATAVGGGEWSGHLTLVLRDEVGAPVSVEAGDRLLATVDGISVTLEVPELTGALQPMDAGGSGSAAPRGALVLEGETEPAAWLRLARETPLGEETRADETGVYAWAAEALSEMSEPRGASWAGDDGRLSHEPSPGRLLQTVLETEDGHHARLRWVGLTVEVDLSGDGGPALSGVGSPGEEVEVLTEQGMDGGAERVAATAIVGPGERWSLTESPWEAEDLEPGAPLIVTSAGWRLETRASVLSIRQEGSALSGRGPRDEVLELRLRVPGAAVEESRTVLTDAEGAWSFDLTDDLDLQRAPSEAGTSGAVIPLDRATIVLVDGAWTFLRGIALR